ncbi:MAG: FtsX-like permease family protein [Myxococcota bacterium]
MPFGGVRDFFGSLFLATTWRMAARNLFRNGRRTAIVFSAIAIGLGGLMIAMAVNYGMIFEMVQLAIRNELGHIQVHGPGWSAKPGVEIRVDEASTLRGVSGAALPGLRAWAPRVRGEGLASSARGNVGIALVAIDPEREAAVTGIREAVFEGAYLEGDQRRALVGERLARRLHVGVGDRIVVSAQDVAGDLTGEAFRVGGVFRTASLELDERTVFVPLGRGRRMLGMHDEISELVVVAEEQEGVDVLRAALAERLPGDLEVRTWSEIRPLLQYMVDMFQQMGWIIYAAIFIAMAFGIANVLLMSVYERMREIGIMMAIGMKPGRMVGTVVAESLCLTLLGVAGGFALGIGGVWLLSDGIDLSRWAEGLNAFGVPARIVPVIPQNDLIAPVVVAVVTALIASLWPAVRAVRARPAEAVRHV